MDTRNKGKNIGNILKHAAIIIVVLVLSVGLPLYHHFGSLFFGKDADAVSGATVELPDKPSGNYAVLISKSRHKGTLKDWETFFEGKELPVIFEDVSCVTAIGDVSGQKMAERFQAQLPENQMTLRSEDATLLASKVEAGQIDIVVFSREMADSVKLHPPEDTDDVAMINIAGGGK